MSYSHKFGIGPDNYVKRILFERTYQSGGVEVSASYGWAPEDTGKRPSEWTKEELDVEYARCDQVVGFTSLLRERHSKRVGRGATAEVVKPFQE